jgi:serralysin
LGHAGNYNVTATYPYDALFQNDAWPLSIMSYFSTSDNSSYGYSEQFVLTPMAADIVAMQSLYGLSTTTRTGDTTYGYNSNAGTIFNAGTFPDAAYTIFDNGGMDTLDFSGSPYAQRINLNSETFSDVNGHSLDLYIARGVTIENAIGGAGDDAIKQNAANNMLNGGAGIDTVSYETAAAGVIVDLSLSTAQNTGGAGIDTIVNFEHIIGSAFADVLMAGPTTISLSGGAGDDLIGASTTTQPGTLGMYGGDGNDLFLLGGGEEWIDGGTGFNTVDASNSTVGMILITNGHAGTGVDTLVNIQKIIGSSYADTLYAWNGDTIIGGAGDDTLLSLVGNSNLAGGAGNDTYVLSNPTDQLAENAGEGIDTVAARGDYALGDNVENLTLAELISSDPYAGAALPPPNQPEDWNGMGNDLANVIVGNAGTNMLSGLGGVDAITGGLGADTFTGGAGDDTFKDTVAGLNSDTITDFSRGDIILFTDATLAGFSFLVLGDQLTYTGGSLTLNNLHNATIAASAALGGGVQITFASPPIVISSGQNVASAIQAGLAAETKTDLSWYGAIESNSFHLFEQDRHSPDTHILWRDSLEMNAHWDGQGEAVFSLAPDWRAADLFQ